MRLKTLEALLGREVAQKQQAEKRPKRMWGKVSSS